MGVTSLTSLIKNNENYLFESFELCDTTLIIDGYSLAHCLYFTGQCDFLFGGEYCQYRSIVAGFFAYLKSCNVDPIVIFDGPFDHGNVKRRTWRLRHKSKVAQCSKAVRKVSY
uniref:XPG N-terminal domain-containing protein n=1 Tax=Romanomermis culicivorax TaxID=13658 RepID=A0A915JYU3_ROMCU